MGIRYLQQHGVARGSRNGAVLQAPSPVTTAYQRPQERLALWPQRDANVAFLVYEGLWMLAGRHDLAPLLRYVKTFGQFSDNGSTLHGAYGFRWRAHFDVERGRNIGGLDQLAVIARQLTQNREDRRCVLQMWDADGDLGTTGKDVPCNTIASVQRTAEGALDLTVFCRSNDILWGAYFANAYHFSLLQEYLAAWIGCPVGTYYQVSVNWHAYKTTLAPLADLPAAAFVAGYASPEPIPDPYVLGTARAVPLMERRHGEDTTTFMARLDGKIQELLTHADTGFTLPKLSNDDEPWFDAAYAVLRAHEAWRINAAPERFSAAYAALAPADPCCDMVVGMRRWLDHRLALWQAKQEVASV